MLALSLTEDPLVRALYRRCSWGKKKCGSHIIVQPSQKRSHTHVSVAASQTRQIGVQFCFALQARGWLTDCEALNVLSGNIESILWFPLAFHSGAIDGITQRACHYHPSCGIIAFSVEQAAPISCAWGVSGSLSTPLPRPLKRMFFKHGHLSIALPTKWSGGVCRAGFFVCFFGGQEMLLLLCEGPVATSSHLSIPTRQLTGARSYPSWSSL